MSALADLRIVAGLPWLAAVAVLLLPRQAARACALGATAIGVAAALACSAGAPAIDLPWLGRGVALRLALGPLAALGLVATAIAGLLAVLEEETRRRDRLAGLLALQGTVLGALLADDAVVLAAAWALAPALVLGLLGARASEAEGRIAGRALALFLSLGAGAILLVGAGLAVAHRGASSGTWSAALVDLASVRVPAGAGTALAAALALAGTLAIGLWPLHAGLVEGTAVGSRGTARLLAGPVRWLGLDALIRVWAPLVPLGAAATAPWLAGLATLGAIYAGLSARVETDPERRAARIALVGWSVAVVGVASLTHEGLAGALLLAVVAGLGQPGLARADAVTRVVLGLAAALAGALVVGAALRPADLTLGALGPWCACGSALALGLAGSAMSRGTGSKEHVVADMADGADSSGHVPTRWSAAALAVVVAVAIARPNLVLGRVDEAGEAWVRASALQRCLALVDPRVVPVLLPPVLPTRCESPLAGLRAGLASEAERQVRGE
ncbi:hypothetical protein SAMN02745121_00692 [Nannocystis exedens]|uniref:NADH:quinone oxidoreductase/Mrp antiporter membrane subunit domain-containing protein n=1 Tax=Nannocystis exedens TaxID=54 RepID=A0A1I1TGE2_9BACT|nr:hypothetical protein [Nannocystis exedens]PCC66578.1 NADH-quinone oxidoreductase subunit M [Nannocystis exedens]SFD57676.1 hypothetical protein SAMN02745121_00692 [Nannocystis exedens]